jgi:hypothetical protein
MRLQPRAVCIAASDGPIDQCEQALVDTNKNRDRVLGGGHEWRVKR